MRKLFFLSLLFTIFAFGCDQPDYVTPVKMVIEVRRNDNTLDTITTPFIVDNPFISVAGDLSIPGAGPIYYDIVAFNVLDIIEQK